METGTQHKVLSRYLLPSVVEVRSRDLSYSAVVLTGGDDSVCDDASFCCHQPSTIGGVYEDRAAFVRGQGEVRGRPSCRILTQTFCLRLDSLRMLGIFRRSSLASRTSLPLQPCSRRSSPRNASPCHLHPYNTSPLLSPSLFLYHSRLAVGSRACLHALVHSTAAKPPCQHPHPSPSHCRRKRCCRRSPTRLRPARATRPRQSPLLTRLHPRWILWGTTPPRLHLRPLPLPPLRLRRSTLMLRRRSRLSRSRKA